MLFLFQYGIGHSIAGGSDLNRVAVSVAARPLRTKCVILSTGCNALEEFSRAISNTAL